MMMKLDFGRQHDTMPMTSDALEGENMFVSVFPYVEK